MKSLSENGSKSVDFPVLHPRSFGQPYKYAFCGAGASVEKCMPLQGFVKIDVEQGKVVQKWLPKEEHEFLSELVFAPRSEEEDDGYLLGYLLNGSKKTTKVVVFDAKNIEQGPVASSEPLQDYMSHSLHGTFAPGFAPDLTDSVKATFS